MADPSPRLSVPATFMGIDEAAYVVGSPTSSWLGRQISRGIRWLNAHLRRRFSHAFVQGSSVVDLPMITDPAGEIVDLRTHYGTPGIRAGEWYLRAQIPVGASCVVEPFVETGGLLPIHTPFADGRLGEETYAGTDGAAHNYGPIATPLREGARRMGLLVAPLAAGDVVEDSGEVWYAHLNRVVSTLADGVNGDFAGLTRPYPSIALFDSTGAIRISPWTQIIGVDETLVQGDTVITRETLTHSLQVWDQSIKPAVTWATMLQPEIVVLGYLMREVP